MLSLIHDGAALSRVAELDPAFPELWTRGQIVYFTIDYPPLGDDVDEAVLVSSSGSLWLVEVMVSGPARDPSSRAGAGVIVRILKKLEATQELLDRVKDSPTANIARFPSVLRDREHERELDHSAAGAA
ncbi:hypothetical protein OKA04_24125 [Luteolibacter flavescens]|uniref:Uncharacterized protein n=1 Tax=Luteolibacter flavescens TaxID=1859460 RepID=A0ABT3FW76_9BACT|nr:hypothetical protein [Luteolibacter flavescens]MCW1887848.1 hypothetical protein [Luteolibacter flavescens]